MLLTFPVEETAQDTTFQTSLLDLDAFVLWVCEHESEVIGQAGTLFHCPLAQWLASRTGHVYGVDTSAYGRACVNTTHWARLPLWAQRFSSRLEARAFRPVTGYEALLVLADVERTLASITPLWK